MGQGGKDQQQLEREHFHRPPQAFNPWLLGGKGEADLHPDSDLSISYSSDYCESQC